MATISHLDNAYYDGSLITNVSLHCMKDFQVNYIRQEHRTGCGIACVAMVADVSYSEVMEIARKTFGWLDTQRTFYTSSAQLQVLLRALEIKAKKGRTVRKWSSLPETAIVGINHNEKKDTWHWVVYYHEADVGQVLDPQSKHGVRKDFNRMRLRSCMPIDLTHLYELPPPVMAA